MAEKVWSYETHRHLPTPTIVGAVFWLVAIVCFGLAWFGWPLVNLGLVSLSLAVLVLLGISRTYTTALQDRIIRLEMRLRCERVLGQERCGRIARLSKGQLVALRFASDAELPGLVDRALEEGLTPDQIKRSIRQWVPDDDRT